MQDLAGLVGAAADDEARRGVFDDVFGIGVDARVDFAGADFVIPEEAADSYGIATEVAVVGVKGGAEAVGCCVEFVDDGDVEALGTVSVVGLQKWAGELTWRNFSHTSGRIPFPHAILRLCFLSSG